MAKRKYVYFSEIDRFGYTLHCIGLDEEETRRVMINEYVRVYKQENGVDPRTGDYIDREYYDNFIDELYIDKRELYDVVWD